MIDQPPARRSRPRRLRRHSAAAEFDAPRRLLVKLADEAGLGLKEVSVRIGANVAYVSQYLAGKPAELPEDKRVKLGSLFGRSPDDFRSSPAPGPLFALPFHHAYDLSVSPLPGFEIPETMAPPPGWSGVGGMFARVRDGHAARTLPPGAAVWALTPSQLGRQLQTGDRVIVETGSGGSTVRMLMLIGLSPDVHDIVLTTATNDVALQRTITLTRPEPAGTPSAIVYRWQEGDFGAIVGVAIGAYWPLP